MTQEYPKRKPPVIKTTETVKEFLDRGGKIRRFKPGCGPIPFDAPGKTPKTERRGVPRDLAEEARFNHVPNVKKARL